MVVDSEKPFEGILGNSSELKLLEHLIACQKLKFNITELSKMVGVSRNITTSVIARFLKWKIVNVEKEIGKMKLYSLHEQSELVKLMMNFSNEVIDALMEIENSEIQNSVSISRKIGEADPNEFNFVDIGYEQKATAEKDIDWLFKKPKEESKDLISVEA